MIKRNEDKTLIGRKLENVIIEGIPKDMITNAIDLLMGDSATFTIQITSLIYDSEENSFLIGDPEQKAKILSNNYHTCDTNRLTPHSNIIITTSLSSSAILNLYDFFPMVYIIIFCFSMFLFFFSKHYLHKIRLREDQLANSNKTKDRFFSIIAHDLRNPITALQNLASIFHDHYATMSPKQVKQSTDILIKSTSHAGKMLENLLK